MSYGTTHYWNKKQSTIRLCKYCKCVNHITDIKCYKCNKPLLIINYQKIKELL